MELVFATNNKHKLIEASEVLADDILLLNLDDIGCEEDIAETENTFQGNALLKAKYISLNFECNCFADDSGLEVSHLNGAPGVYSARYAGEHGDSEKNMDKLLTELDGVSNRDARFVTVIALLIDGEEYFFEGYVEGEILTKKQGERGFGYDPIFKPKGFDMSFAEMTSREKNSISHRARALKKMQDFLEERFQIK